METLIARIERLKPFFDKVAANKYLGAIRDGFLTAMPAILFSSVFMLCASIPEVVGITLPEGLSTWLYKVYGYTMGVVGLLVSATTARSLAESMNRSMPEGKSINAISAMLASICGFLLLAVAQTDTGLATDYMGTKGLIAAFVSAFATCNIYRQCVIKDITIHMPKEVPGVIAQMFRDIFPFSFAVLFCVVIERIMALAFGITFAEGIITVLKPLFSAADGYLGICLIWGAMALFWFVGVHGPSIVEPAIAAIIYANVDSNFALYQAGQHASNVLTVGLGNFVGTMGGTGATLVVPFLFLLFAKSKQLKAVGKASFVPVCFAVNEPLLFGAPIVLNPYLFVPFILAPMVNVSLFKFFVDVLGMNSFIYVLPWATPAPIGLILGTGLAPLSVILAVLLIAVDAVIYFPFIKAYDASLCEEEAARLEEENAAEEAAGNAAASAAEAPTAPETAAPATPELDHDLRVLVLCVGAGTSQMFANAIMDGAEQENLPVKASAAAYGSHYDMLKNFDLVIMSPQVAPHFDEVTADAGKYGAKVVQTRGKQYIDMTHDPKAAVEFAIESAQK